MTEIITPARKRERSGTLEAQSQARSAWLFLSPNLLGFLIFLAGPLLCSLAMAFTNWDLRANVPLEFVGLQNFRDLLNSDEFWSYAINTLYLMIGIPISIAGSLGLALLLTKPLKENTLLGRVIHAGLVLLVAVVISAGCYGLGGGGALAPRVAAGVILLGGCVWAFSVFMGIVVYRTLFYLPSFTSGVALFILWKALYNTQNGPINAALSWVFDAALIPINFFGQHWPSVWFLIGAEIVVVGLIAAFAWLNDGRRWNYLASILALIAMRVVLWDYHGPMTSAATVIGLAIALALIGLMWSGPAQGRFALVLPTVLWAFAVLFCWYVVAQRMNWTPHAVFTPWQPPQWLAEVRNVFAITPIRPGVDRSLFGVGTREALIIMGVVTGVGGGNMLLYLAGLSNIPQELYEAADIDGATGWARFWHVTWPQLAPTTFFITVMSIIGGFQGGFDVAKVMTGGGPSGTTTTLSYHIYSKAFDEFRLGYASAVAWVLFAIVFTVTALNWRFGSKQLND